jgi:hypothetical protein
MAKLTKLPTGDYVQSNSNIAISCFKIKEEDQKTLVTSTVTLNATQGDRRVSMSCFQSVCSGYSHYTQFRVTY